MQNQPGAGSLTMTNQLYAAGPFDGTAIGASFNGLPTTPLLQPTGARFEAVKLNWVGSTNRETQAMYVWHTTPVQTLGDLTSKEMIVGAQAPGSTQYDYPKLAEKLFGWKIKVITGYEATPKIHLAMERGEVHGTWANWSTLKAIAGQWIEEKKIRILAQWALRKHPELPDVRSFSTRPRPRSRSSRSTWRWRGSNSAGRSSCRRTCRPSGSMPSAARSMRR